MYKPKHDNGEKKEFEERILHLRRVSKKTSGGNYISFSALVAIGDGKGKVGLGMGRGREVPPAIQKAITQAKKHMLTVPIYNDTLPHHVELKYKASRILLKPAPPGTGLKVGGVVRVILDLAGVNNASGKIMGSRNQITNAHAVMAVLRIMKPRITEGKAPKAEEVKEAKPVKAEIVENKMEPKVEKVEKTVVKAKKPVTEKKEAKPVKKKAKVTKKKK